jgi:hypothetical protein
MNTHQRTVAHLDTITQLVAQAHDADAVMRAVDLACAELIGHQLFTIMVVHHQTMEVERLYSNMPDSYPVAGRKRKRATWWGEHVVERGEAFLGTGAADLEKAFADHVLIKSLGLGCVLNMPLVLRGKTCGTMNLLHAGDHYHHAHVPLARVLAHAMMPIFLTPISDS